MKVAVIGNSQVGALRKGFNTRNFGEFDILDFFGVAGGGGPELIFEGNNCEFVGDSRVNTNRVDFNGIINIEDYDTVVLSGVGIAALRPMNSEIAFLQKYLVAKYVTNVTEADYEKVLDIEIAEELIKHNLTLSPSFQNIHKLMECNVRRIIIQMFPLPTEDICSQRDFTLDYHDKAGFLGWYYNVQASVIRDLCEKSDKLSFLNYPENWFEKGFTPFEFSSNNDAWHLNENFGVWYLNCLIQHIGSFEYKND